MKKALVVRLGAFGDSIIITPVLRELKRLGYHVILETSWRGVQVLADNPNIDEMYEYEDNKVPNDQLHSYWEQFKAYIKPDKYINFCESIEVELALHPDRKEYKELTREQKFERCNKNYYEFSMKWAGLDSTNYTPELFFTSEEEKWAKKRMKRGSFNIVLGLMGSGLNKLYPWFVKLVYELDKKYGESVNILTVGDARCLDIEADMPRSVTKFSNRIGVRESFVLTKYADLVIAPDTGLLHASGCYDTPKIGLLGHTTKENITKHFKNDYSIEAQCHCAPCFNLVYDYKDQCPVDHITGAAKCMGQGIPLSTVLFNVDIIYSKWKNKER